METAFTPFASVGGGLLIGLGAVLLMLGGVAGAQYGAYAGQRLRGEQLRAMLALLVLAVAFRLAYTLFVAPDDIYTVGVGAA